VWYILTAGFQEKKGIAKLKLEVGLGSQRQIFVRAGSYRKSNLGHAQKLRDYAEVYEKCYFSG